ncbi:MAG TPA: YbhB/YbcL family Raf kinase inhibitor-like protein [Candidatus Sulfotelmatobacter sp.]|nr:YbhB/YbcL family Raf kinase inhibitor-like protein [Candidatus Sulfotelmatobacter sp.]
MPNVAFPKIALHFLVLAFSVTAVCRTLAAQSEKTSSPLTISSASFPSGGTIAKKYTCDGPDVSPQLSWTDPPPGTQTFALLADDPDAPGGNWNHWTIWNLPAGSRSLPEGASKEEHLTDGSQQGKNDFPKIGYNGPCPPPGSPHRYYFKLFALDIKLNLKPGAGKKELEAAMQGHILAHAEWMGRYGR